MAPSRLHQALQVAAVCALLLAGCGSENASESSPGARDRGSPSGPPARGSRGSPFSRGPTLVVAETVGLRDIREEVEAIGTTRANESVTITAQVTDTVSKVKFEDGDYAQLGDVLIELTNEEETALLAESEANLNDARTQYQRLENLLEDGSIPVSQVDEARARLSAAQARYQSVVARLADRLIRAPFSGLLGFRDVSPGTLVSPGTTITTLDDIAVIKLDFSIPEVYLTLVEPGMQLVASSSAFPGTRFEATVRTVGSRIDPITRAATVRAHIDNPSLILRPGMLLTVKLTTARREALMVPEIALIQRASQAYVYVINNGQADLVEVENGTRYQGWVEILNGLEAGQLVVSEGVIKIRDGSAVRTSSESLSTNSDADRRRFASPGLSPGR